VLEKIVPRLRFLLMAMEMLALLAARSVVGRIAQHRSLSLALVFGEYDIASQKESL
jgi:hypothetical protein